MTIGTITNNTIRAERPDVAATYYLSDVVGRRRYAVGRAADGSVAVKVEGRRGVTFAPLRGR